MLMVDRIYKAAAERNKTVTGKVNLWMAVCEGGEKSVEKIDKGSVTMCYGYKDGNEGKRQGEIVYNKTSENLVEISLVYADLLEKHRELSSIDSINWKQMFVQWANDFETVNEGIDWNHEDYLEKIEKFAPHQILEYAGLEG